MLKLQVWQDGRNPAIPPNSDAGCFGKLVRRQASVASIGMFVVKMLINTEARQHAPTSHHRGCSQLSDDVDVIHRMLLMSYGHTCIEGKIIEWFVFITERIAIADRNIQIRRMKPHRGSIVARYVSVANSHRHVYR